MLSLIYAKVDENFFGGLSMQLKVVVRAEILPKEFLQTPGNYYL